MSVFRSDDGREIDEADLRLLLRYVPGAVFYGNTEPLEVVKRLSAALTPKPAPTCGAYIKVDHMEGPPNIFRCVLPPGHHPVVYDHNIEAPRCTCGRDLLHENHAPGHMPSADSWVVPNG